MDSLLEMRKLTINSLIELLEKLETGRNFQPDIRMSINIYADNEIMDVIYNRSQNKAKLKSSESMEIGFYDMQKICLFCKKGMDGAGIPRRTCRHKANIPNEHSWGKCELSVCPIVNRSDILP